MDEKDAKKPVKTFSCGPIRATIWCNSRIMDDAVVEVHSVRISRSYKDGDEWKNTNTFNTEDLPKVAILAKEAYKFIRVRSPENNNRVMKDDVQN